MVQVEWYQNNQWYVESRYNYEALNSLSVYLGRSYEKSGTLSYAVCPMAAIVWGNFKGGSVGVNTDVSYEKLSYSMQAQYTFCVEDRSENYIYSWSELGYQVTRKVNTGILVQQLKSFCTKNSLKSGIYLKCQVGRLTFPLYVFNLTSGARSFVLGLNFQRESSKKQAPKVQF